MDDETIAAPNTDPANGAWNDRVTRDGDHIEATGTTPDGLPWAVTGTIGATWTITFGGRALKQPPPMPASWMDTQHVVRTVIGKLL